MHFFARNISTTFFFLRFGALSLSETHSRTRRSFLAFRFHKTLCFVISGVDERNRDRPLTSMTN